MAGHPTELPRLRSSDSRRTTQILWSQVKPALSGPPAISISKLSKRYGDRLAVDDVSLDIEKGTVYGLLGPNGAGKTTIVRVLSTIVRPTSGKAVVNGFDVQTDPGEVRKSVGVLPEDTGLYDRLNAQETLRFYGGMQGVTGERLEKRIEELLRLLDLYERRNDRVAVYSRGMRQKLALARALIHDPPILLLDEPTLGLDVMSTLAIRDYAKKAAGEGKTVLLNTNNMYEAQLLCDRLTIISKGSVRATGTVGDLEQLAKTKGLEEVFVNLIRSDRDVTN
jgi:ABC-type multidrug transport system ATPase subunit